jgi:hypothetical protein
VLRRVVWKKFSSGVLRRVVWKKFTDVSGVFAASIIKAIASDRNIPEHPIPEDKSSSYTPP